MVPSEGTALYWPVHEQRDGLFISIMTFVCVQKVPGRTLTWWDRD